MSFSFDKQNPFYDAGLAFHIFLGQVHLVQAADIKQKRENTSIIQNFKEMPSDPSEALQNWVGRMQGTLFLHLTAAELVKSHPKV